MPLQGTVDRLDTEGKFGFIIGPNGEEYFFHQSALMGVDYDQLAPGVPVTFDTDDDAPGDRPDEHIRAINIRLGEDAPPVVDNELIPPQKAFD